MPGGRIAGREKVEHFGAVAIAALDEDDRLVMIYQYRPALGRRMWEMPAGLLDEPGEDPVEAAQRELVEEVGVEADEWSTLVDIVGLPGLRRRVGARVPRPRAARRWSDRPGATTRRPTS